MTRIAFSAPDGFLPVVFRVYHVIDNGPNKGKPVLPGITMTLNRFVGCSMHDKRFESVGDTVGRLKDMLAGSSARYSIIAAKETDEERNRRRAKEGVVVVTAEVSEDAHPIIDGDYKRIDTNIEGDKDTGRVSVKRARKPAKEARVAA
jgi:hypothetical protein